MYLFTKFGNNRSCSFCVYCLESCLISSILAQYYNIKLTFDSIKRENVWRIIKFSGQEKGY